MFNLPKFLESRVSTLFFSVIVDFTWYQILFTESSVIMDVTELRMNKFYVTWYHNWTRWMNFNSDELTQLCLWIMITSFPRHLLSDFVWNEVLISCNIWSSWMSNEAHFFWQWIMKPLWKSAYTRLDPCSSLRFHLPLPKVKWRHITEHWPTAHLPL